MEQNLKNKKIYSLLVILEMLMLTGKKDIRQLRK